MIDGGHAKAEAQSSRDLKKMESLAIAILLYRTVLYTCKCDFAAYYGSPAGPMMVVKNTAMEKASTW
jgi:hypothetical protein